MTKGKFPNGLRKAMDAKGLGFTDLANLAETSKQNIERWANGERRLKPEMAAKLAPLVNATASQLLLLPNEDGATTTSQPQHDKDRIMKEAAAQNLRSALIAYGVDAKQLKRAMGMIDRMVTPAKPGRSKQNLPHDQSQPATLPHAKEP